METVWGAAELTLNVRLSRLLVPDANVPEVMKPLDTELIVADMWLFIAEPDTREMVDIVGRVMLRTLADS